MKVSNGQLELMKRDRIILGSHCGNRACSLAGVQQEFVQDYQSLDLMLKTYNKINSLTLWEIFIFTFFQS